jgi:hypothetical protein
MLRIVPRRFAAVAGIDSLRQRATELKTQIEAEKEI